MLDLTQDKRWDQLRRFYVSGRPEKPLALGGEVSSGSGFDQVRTHAPLQRILKLLREEHHAVSALIEKRYIDRDWRSENASYYASTFMRRPSVCHRIHFFTSKIPRDLDVSGMQDSYLGYVVMRPVPYAPVGRTMLKPPPRLEKGFRAEATETVDILGWPLSVTASPFISQDGQFLRCAHAAMWMAGYHFHLAMGGRRWLPGEVHEAALGGMVMDRQLPSEGVSYPQMLGAMTTMGMSPARVKLSGSRMASAKSPDSDLYPLMCRQVNSNLPALVRSRDHVWLVVGYTAEASSGSDRVTLWVHDDALGPYLEVDSPWEPDKSGREPSSPRAARRRREAAKKASRSRAGAQATPAATSRSGGSATTASAPEVPDGDEKRFAVREVSRDWQAAILPLPAKLYMTAERAERTSRTVIDAHLARMAKDGQQDLLTEASDRQSLMLRTYACRGRDYKHGLRERIDVDPELAKWYRGLQFPAWLWIVEMLDRDLVESDPGGGVLGELLIDPTAMREPTLVDTGLLAVHFPGWARANAPEYGTSRDLDPAAKPYLSGRRPGPHGGSTSGST